MKRVFKLAGVTLASVAAFVVFAIAGAFAASEVMIRWPAKAAPSRLVSAADAGAVERGHRVAVLNGCHDCHGAKLEGRMFEDMPGIMKAYAPNLSLILPEHGDAEIDAGIRQGVGVDGRPLWVMPSNAFSHLTDAETADLIAYLRTFKPTGEKQPGMQIRPLARVGILLAKFEAEPATTAKAKPLPDLGPQYATGRDLTRLCVECHGQELKGNAMLKSPDLNVAAAYDGEDFARLMKTGVGAGGRQLGLMGAAARDRYHLLSPAEVTALHGYLKARAAAQPAT